MKFLFCVMALALCHANTARAAEMRMAVTTSFHNSGLSDVLLPMIRKDLNLDVKLLVVGTGQALRLGRAGDVDAILVHSKSAELKFVAEGYSTHRREIMFNDFVIVGPKDDPARLAASQSATSALQKIATSKAIFVSRGDDSGTHKKEQVLWKETGVSIDNQSANWYRSVGSGMGATLNTASAMNAYVLSDRASWLKFGNKGDLKLLYSGDPVLFNQYAYMPVNPAKHSHVASEQALRLEEWLTGSKAQAAIGAYEIEGEKLFTPNAK